MKKLLAIAGLCALSLSVQAFDQERFERDTAQYNKSLQDGKAIVTLLNVFNTDNGVRQAFENRLNGDIKKWKNMVNRLKGARDYSNKIDVWSYLSSCRNSSIYADSMWNNAAGIRNWRDKDNFYVQQYVNAKQNFQSEYHYCKQSVNKPPQKEDYERKTITFGG